MKCACVDPDAHICLEKRGQVDDSWPDFDPQCQICCCPCHEDNEEKEDDF